MLTDARVDEVEAFLDLLADGRWRGNVIALRMKAGFVGGVVNGDQLSLGTRVREGSLLYDRLRPVLTLADGFDVTALLGDNVVARFVTAGRQCRGGVLNNRLRKPAMTPRRGPDQSALRNAKMRAGERKKFARIRDFEAYARSRVYPISRR